MWSIPLATASIFGAVHTTFPPAEHAIGQQTDGAAATQETNGQPQAELSDPVSITDKLGFVIQKGTEGSGLTVVQEAGGWSIQDGDATLANDRLNRPGLQPNLRIDRLATGKDLAIVKVVLTPSKRSAEFVRVLETVNSATPLNLIDTNGTKYPAVGFIFRDTTTTRLRYTPGNPLKGLTDAPAIGRNRPDRELTLIFIVNNGVDIKELKVEKISLEDWSAKPRHVEAARRP